MNNIIPVTVKGVYVIEARYGLTPLILLSDESDNILPIYVGVSEAMSIYAALQKEVAPRPMTHDLMISILEQLDTKIDYILIDDLDDGIYYARLIIQTNGLKKELDARPSDCIALALRANAPIKIRKKVLDDAAINKEDLKGIMTIDNYL